MTGFFFVPVSAKQAARRRRSNRRRIKNPRGTLRRTRVWQRRRRKPQRSSSQGDTQRPSFSIRAFSLPDKDKTSQSSHFRRLRAKRCNASTSSTLPYLLLLDKWIIFPVLSLLFCSMSWYFIIFLLFTIKPSHFALSSSCVIHSQVWRVTSLGTF